MAVGAAFLMFKNTVAFYGGLGLLIVGNGFFKPNISNIVGTLYHQFPTKRDGGFTIFYIGINLGAAPAPLLCGYIGEKGDWAYGFGLATIGMLVGLAVFVVAPWMAQIIIGGGAIAGIAGLCYYHPSEMVSIILGIFVAIALAVSATVAILAIHRAACPPAPGPAGSGTIETPSVGRADGRMGRLFGRVGRCRSSCFSCWAAPR